MTQRQEPTYVTAIADGTDFQALTVRKFSNFLNAVRGEADPAVPGAVGLQITSLTEAAYRAVDEGLTVDVHATIDEAKQPSSTPLSPVE